MSIGGVLGNEAGISLVVCTRNRSHRLNACLQTLVSQECSSPWEVILVDSGSTDDTFEILNAWKAEYAPLVVVARTQRPGLGHARNVGCALARYRLIAFTDDDCYPSSDYLQSIVTVFASNDRLGVISGRIMLHNSGDYPITVNESVVARELPPRSAVPAGFVQGANMAIRSRVLSDIGGFDGELGAGTRFANEDLDVAGRASAAGWVVRYEPSAVVRHDHGRKAGLQVTSLKRTYDRGRGAYYMKMLLGGNWQYLRLWLSTARSNPIAVTAREFFGAIEYCFAVKGGLHRGGR